MRGPCYLNLLVLAARPMDEVEEAEMSQNKIPCLKNVSGDALFPGHPLELDDTRVTHGDDGNNSIEFLRHSARCVGKSYFLLACVVSVAVGTCSVGFPTAVSCVLRKTTEAFFVCFELPNIGNRLNSVWEGRKEELKEGRSVTARTVSR
eukprot:scaffold3031_cov171-Skeletonema_marinoi.AAC.2